MSSVIGNLLYGVAVCGGIALLVKAADVAAKRKKPFTPDEIRTFADDLRKELLARALIPGRPVDIRDYAAKHPYYRGIWAPVVWRLLVKEGTLTSQAPTWDRVLVSEKAIEQARMERLVAAAEQPRTVNNYRAGVVQVGDNNTAREVTASFGGDHDRLLSDLIAALVAVAGNASLQPQLRQAAEQGAADLGVAAQGNPSRIPAILERIKGIVSVATVGFESVRPIIDALTHSM